jgi:hypothetical protein
MSAFICSDKHISAIVNHFDFIEDKQAMGQFLLDANVESVNYRYSRDTKLEFELEETTNTDEEVYTLIRSLNYQSCEVEDYEETAMYKILDKFQKELFSRGCDENTYVEDFWDI